MWYQELVQLAVSNIYVSAAALTAVVCSIIALLFVFSKNRSPESKRDSRLVAVAHSENVSRIEEDIVTIIVEKSFIKSNIQRILDERKVEPRFTFREFALFGMPALITLCLIVFSGIIIFKASNPAKAELPAFMAQAFTAVVAYYFGAATAKR
ncbi:hypothetical protein [Ancylobacter sp. TS-1]|uniref:hypothetical protein n=1 Tax=Ancylobacter sp. TS-1 TaxID=1850374 RepID=UPI001265B005|nr:hypothetical protein [Ancylobacter sp. TS-1]QFR33542.1 hypothetical protein GBB76_10660 [Ancylobacter sp. TS-1]